MDNETILRHIATGVERWKVIRDRQYQMKLPVGVYTTDLPLCVLLAELPGSGDELIARIEQAAGLLNVLRNDPRVGAILRMGSDATAVLALASIPGDLTAPPVQEQPIPEVAAPIPVPIPQPPPPLAAAAAVPEPVLPVPVPIVPPPAPFVPGCEHVGSDGKCSECTGDRTVECSGCEELFVLSGGLACRMGEDACGQVFCRKCALEYLNERGYCDDCSRVVCDGCDEDLDRDDETWCKARDCERCYCAECAKHYLTAEGTCPECAGEEVFDCNGECNGEFVSSRLTFCAKEGCEMAFCDACKPEYLDANGLCGDCAEEDEE